MVVIYLFKKDEGFPGGLVVKNLPVNAGDMNKFNPWSGRIPHASEQPSPCPTTSEARAPGAYALQQEKPPKWEAWAL